MTDESKRKIAAALKQGQKNRNALAFYTEVGAKAQGEKAAKVAIIQAVKEWTGHPVKGGKLPISRNGCFVHYEPSLLFSSAQPHVDAIAKEVWAEKTSEIRARLKKFQTLMKDASSLTENLGALSIADKARLRPTSIDVTFENIEAKGREHLEKNIIKSIGSVNSTLTSCQVLIAELEDAIARCKAELGNRQEKAGRPRDEAKYKVAEGFAVLFAKVTGEKPTFSQDPNGYHGKFTPALRDLFDAIGWESTDLEAPATAACKAVRMEDIDAPINKTLGGLLGLTEPST